MGRTASASPRAEGKGIGGKGGGRAPAPLLFPASFCFFFLVVVQFESHAVVNFVVLERDVVLVNGVPLLDSDLLPLGACEREGGQRRDSQRK